LDSLTSITFFDHSKLIFANSTNVKDDHWKHILNLSTRVNDSTFIYVPTSGR
jgi:hypothetical protein